jgi:hypothetical protein
VTPSRRTILRTAGATTLAGLAGCLDAVRGGHVDVAVENRDDRSHEVDVTVRSGGDAVAEERFVMPAGSTVEAEDVVGAGTYDVTVALDGEARTEVLFTMQGCPDNTLFVAVEDDGQVEAGVLEAC